MAMIFRWVINAAGLMAIATIIPGVVVTSFGWALFAAFMLGLVNALVRPLLFILTLPVTIMTLGLFTFILNAFMLWLVSTVVEGFAIAGFAPAILAAIFMWLISLATNSFIKHAKES